MKNLTYRISKYPRNLGRSETDEEVSKAFDVWSEVTPLTFTQKFSGQVRPESMSLDLIRFSSTEYNIN